MKSKTQNKALQHSYDLLGKASLELYRMELRIKSLAEAIRAERCKADSEVLTALHVNAMGANDGKLGEALTEAKEWLSVVLEDCDSA